jgi:hypothetical protein
MTEPLFCDCLTDAQFWSLLDSGVLQAYMLPWEVYERLDRIAPAHGCYLFTWPVDADLPALQDIVPGLAASGQESPDQRHSDGLRTRVAVDRIRSAIDVFRAHVRADMPAVGRRLLVISTSPDLDLRPGPYLEPPSCDLTAMSMAELEAYLDAVLAIDDRNHGSSPAFSTHGPHTTHRNHAHP